MVEVTIFIPGWCFDDDNDDHDDDNDHDHDDHDDHDHDDHDDHGDDDDTEMYKNKMCKFYFLKKIYLEKSSMQAFLTICHTLTGFCYNLLHALLQFVIL